MRRGSFYRIQLDKAIGFLFGEDVLDELEGKFFCLLEEEKIDEIYYIKLLQVYAVLGDRVIFRKGYEFFVDNPKDFYRCFVEIPLEEVRESIDNTQALLSKEIFNR
ncbi:MAG: hypothetical protein GXO22_00045 [Aquificae bacterium]|nr:hypothetical protein [Aquificota bacterium]